MATVALQSFLQGCRAVEAARPTYQEGHDGSDGLCDCIGLIIGGIRRAGGKWSGTHGSNYAARYEMASFGPIASAGQLFLGEAVYKGRAPDHPKYKLPDKYKPGGASHTGDPTDYYHVGVVVSLQPLRIMHCTGWTGGSGIKVDSSLGEWRYGGELKKVNYKLEVLEMEVLGKATVKTSGGHLNLRDSPVGRDIGDIPNGAVLDVLEKTTAAWWKVVYNGVVGWVAVEFLEVGTLAPDTVAVVLPRDVWRQVRDAINLVMP